jgi:hypothetical protein
MSDNIKQKNFMGDNLVNSTKKTITKHRAQGFIAGILTSLLATIIYEYIIKPNL